MLYNIIMWVLRYPYMPSLKNMCIYVILSMCLLCFEQSIIHLPPQLFM